MSESRTLAPITPELRDAVFESWGNICAYCEDKPAEQVDHIIPQAKGGGHYIENYAAACEGCNRKKRDNILAEGYLRIMEGRAVNKAPKVKLKLQQKIRKIERDRARKSIERAVQKEREKSDKKMEKLREKERKRADQLLEKQRQKFDRLLEMERRKAAISLDQSERNRALKSAESSTSMSTKRSSGHPDIGLSLAQKETREKYIRSMAISSLFKEAGHCFALPPMRLYSDAQREQITNIALQQFGPGLWSMAENKSNSALSGRCNQMKRNHRDYKRTMFTTDIPVECMLEVANAFSHGAVKGESLLVSVDISIANKMKASKSNSRSSQRLPYAAFYSDTSSSHLSYNFYGRGSDNSIVQYLIHPLLAKYLRVAHALNTQGVILPQGVMKIEDIFKSEDCRSKEEMAEQTYQKIIDRYGS